MVEKENNTTPIQFKTKPSVRAELEEMARRREWTLSHTVRVIVEKSLRKRRKAEESEAA